MLLEKNNSKFTTSNFTDEIYQYSPILMKKLRNIVRKTTTL